MVNGSCWQLKFYIIPLITIVESCRQKEEVFINKVRDMTLYRLRDDNVPVLIPIYPIIWFTRWINQRG